MLRCLVVLLTVPMSTVLPMLAPSVTCSGWQWSNPSLSPQDRELIPTALWPRAVRLPLVPVF